MDFEHLIYDCDALEVRQRGRSIGGSFPYNKLAVTRNSGRVRKERFAPGSMAFAIEDPTREVQFLVAHNFDAPVASRLRGSLVLTDTPEALEFEARLPDPSSQPSWVKDLVMSVRSGLVIGLSPGFRLAPRGAVSNDDAESFDPEPGNESVLIRTLKDILLVELSAVSRPIYKEAEIELRSHFPDLYEMMRLL